MVTKEGCRVELREAIRQLRDRGLYTAAKWAAEQLVGIEEEDRVVTPVSGYVRSDRGSSTGRRERRAWSSDKEFLRAGGGLGGGEMYSTPLGMRTHVAASGSGYGTPLFQETEMENDRHMLAKSYFDTHEYRRAAFVLRETPGKKALFLRCYSLYLAGEKRKEEEAIELGGPLGKSDGLNSELAGLEQELSSNYSNGTLDAFGMYLYGIVLHERGKDKLARDVLVKSVDAYPWNWSAWLELQALCTDMSILNSLELKDHWMKEFFLASAYLELHKNIEGLEKYMKLQEIFPFSEYISGQIASGFYNSRDYERAENLYTDMLKYDPYRIDGMDIFSNILYVKESFASLSHLAHRVFLTDKYRPESCCIIGNYYSLKGQHEKAVLYFKRALKLNKNYLSAWTLMGHEYVEMKNTPAAVDAYRRAVDINPRDYRAWYGLGQTYEILAMPYYALYYYRQAALLRPDDARMWIAIGNCYDSEQLQMLDQAMKCYLRALRNNDNEGIAMHKLAKLHSQLGRHDEAASYYKMNLERMENEQNGGPEMIEALLYLANYYKNRKDIEAAQMYCSRLLDYGGPLLMKSKA
ncbi:anaphase-promoting complex subunit 8 isoform X2 [Cryptomeria japonica]|uniref:anaphase-promoting complex subunit 8 isoform X2 n=1 Tax=Cryptomeria japonica TaxID=3369 RepID=UPI0025AD6D31|nr:anaphase-promoting complex subunit 8 isoform X2 [Cryptomeria japonica]